MILIESSTKKILSYLGTIIIVLGIIAAILISVAYGLLLEENGWLAFALFFSFFISSLISGISLKAMSEIVESLEIMNNNIVNIGKNISENKVGTLIGNSQFTSKPQ